MDLAYGIFRGKAAAASLKLVALDRKEVPVRMIFRGKAAAASLKPRVLAHSRLALIASSAAKPPRPH